jgi:hypothetical protein
MEVNKPLIFAIKVTYDKICIFKLYQCAIEHILIKKMAMFVNHLDNDTGFLTLEDCHTIGPKTHNFVSNVNYDNPPKTTRE